MNNVATRERSVFAKALFWIEKIKWGVKIIGVTSSFAGLAKVTALYLTRPDRSRLTLKSGQVLEFLFPSQFPRALLMFGDFIDPEFAFLRKISRPDWIIADVGAAIGQFTVFAATLPVAHVHAFEPSAANFESLSRNIQLNGVSKRVTAHKIAFSNEETEAHFETTASTWVSGLSESGTELVSVRKLSTEFERLGLSNVSVLKINVAGFEPQVIEASQEFLAKAGADILILLLGTESLPWYSVIAKSGYRFFYYHPRENALYEVTAFDADTVLEHRPWPARHIIGIHQSKISDLAKSGVTILQNWNAYSGRSLKADAPGFQSLAPLSTTVKNSYSL